MQALVKYDRGPGNVALQSMPIPEPGAGEVMLKVECCGICGTDLHVFHDTFKNYPPVILGHEFVGRIVDSNHIKIDQPKDQRYAVLGATAITCGECMFCRQGEFMFCDHRRGMGHGVHGAFTKYAVARPDQLFPVSDTVDSREGALVEPLAAAVHAVCEVAPFNLGDVVLVSGPGPIGILCTKLLTRQSIRVLVAGTSEDRERLAMAKALGAATTIVVDEEDLLSIVQEETAGLGVDLAIECAGAEGSVVNCLDSIRPLGHYVQVGHFGKNLTVPWDHVAFKQLQIRGSVGYTRETWRQTMRILEQGFQATDIVTHELPLTDWEEGFRLSEEKKAVKVLLRP